MGRGRLATSQTHPGPAANCAYMATGGSDQNPREMIQLRLDDAGQAPDLAVYAQHDHAGARAWAEVEKVGEQPARGSHASYFSAGVFNLGNDWTGVWFDHANGKRPGPPLTLKDHG